MMKLKGLCLRERIFCTVTQGFVGLYGVVGVATCYGLDSPGIESRWGGRNFPHPSRPTLWPTQPPVQLVKKGKAVPLQAWTGSEGSRKLRFPDFMTTAQDGGRLSALRTGRLYPQEILLVLISVGG